MSMLTSDQASSSLLMPLPQPLLPVVEMTQLPHPEHFSGEVGLCHAFFMQCSIIFKLQLSSFPSDRSKVAYVISLLSRKEGYSQMGAWSICSLFDGSVLNTILLKMDATWALFKSFPGTRLVAEYAVDFHMATGDSWWNTMAFYNAIYRGLAPGVKDEIAAHELPFELENLISLATWIDHCIHKQREEGHPACSWCPRSP